MSLDKSNFYTYFIGLFPLCLIFGNAALNIYFLFGVIFFIYESIINIKIYYKLFDKEGITLLFFFTSILIINLIFHEISLDLFLIIRFCIFYYFIKLIYILNFLSLEKSLRLIVLIFLFVMIDTLIQFFFGYDLLGYNVSVIHSARLTGPFADEPIPGSFLMSFMFLSYFYFFNIKKNKLAGYSIIFLSLFTILLTGERMSFLLSFFGCILIIFFDFKKTKAIIFIIFLILIFILFMVVAQSHVLHLNRYIEIYNLFNFENLIEFQYFQHFMTGYMMFIDNFYFGIGHDNFKNLCSIEKYSFYNDIALPLRCSTHIHNYHLQILVNYGIFTYFLFSSFIIFTLLKLFSIINLKYFYPLLIQLVLIILPFKTSGDLFATWYGSIFWFNLFYLILSIHYKKN